MNNIKVTETLTERIYDLPDNPGWQFVSVQPTGSAIARFTLLGAPPGSWFLSGELQSEMERSAPDADLTQWSAEFSPGSQVWLQAFDASSNAATPLMMLRSICRYPYRRVFNDYYDKMIQHPGQSRVIEYDIEYFTTEAPLDGVKRRVAGTDARLYIDHIYASITADGMSEMEKAKAIWIFVSQAMQHNGIHCNLREIVPALEAFGEDPGGDFDELTMLLLEQGFTRCGVINGFMSASLLKRAKIRSHVVYACGGHTSAIAMIEGKGRIWDVDAFKDGIPLDDNGDIPEYSWVRQPGNYFLLDTKPSYADTPAYEGWITSHEGYRMSGYVGGGRYHSETGYVSSWHSAPKAYPPRPPELLPVLWRQGGSTRLEWYGSYDRDGDFRDYLASVYAPDGSLFVQKETVSPFVELDLPREPGYSFTVQARDWHAKGTPWFGLINYESMPPKTIPAKDTNAPYPWLLLGEKDILGRDDLLAGPSPLDYIEGRENVLGETNLAQTNLWRTECGRIEKPVYRMVDETNIKFSRYAIRSLFARDLPQAKSNAGGWHFTAVVRVNRYDIAGFGMFPMVWLGKAGSHIGAGIGMDCKKGLVCAACNIMGDWRYFDGMEPTGFIRFDIVCEAGAKRLRYYANNQLFSTQDYDMFVEGSFDVDRLYISGNPEAETGYLVSDLYV